MRQYWFDVTGDDGEVRRMIIVARSRNEAQMIAERIVFGDAEMLSMIVEDTDA